MYKYVNNYNEGSNVLAYKSKNRLNRTKRFKWLFERWPKNLRLDYNYISLYNRGYIACSQGWRRVQRELYCYYGLKERWQFFSGFTRENLETLSFDIGETQETGLWIWFQTSTHAILVDAARKKKKYSLRKIWVS